MSMATQTSEGRDVNITLRAHSAQRDLIDHAATLTGKSRTDFMLESACRDAEDVLLDQRLFLLDTAQWDAFNEALNDTRPNDGMTDLMRTKAPWDQ